MSEAKKEFHLRLKHDSADVKVGQDIRFEADASTISSIVSGIGTVATSLGVTGCLALGGAAAGALSIYLISKIINKKWPYAKVSGVKENNVIQVSVPSEKEGTFDDLVKKEKLQKVLQNEFEDIEDNLEGILEEEAYKTYGTQVLDIVRKIRVASITQSGTSMDVPDAAIGNYIASGADDKKELTDVNQLIAAKQGNVIGNYVGEKAKADHKITGGNFMVFSGFGASEVEQITQASSMMRVSFEFDDYSERVEIAFKRDATVYDAKAKLKMKKGQVYDITDERDSLDDKVALSGLPRNLTARKQKD